MMKLNYRTMIEMRTATLQEPGREVVPLMQALIMAHGLPVKASIRLRTLMDGIDTAMKPFSEQRDAILSKYAVRPDEKVGVLVVNPDVEPSEDVEGLDEEGRAAAADKELGDLLAVEYEGLPSIPASMLEDASDRAAEMLVDLGMLGWLSPLIVDDMAGAMPAKRGK